MAHDLKGRLLDLISRTGIGKLFDPTKEGRFERTVIRIFFPTSLEKVIDLDILRARGQARAKSCGDLGSFKFLKQPEGLIHLCASQI